MATIFGRENVPSLDVDVVFGESSSAHTTVTADRGFYYSADGQRRQEELLNVTHKKQCLDPKNIGGDSWARWIPVPHAERTDDLDSESNPLNAVDSEGGSRKRKDYASSDDPASLWRPLKGLFLDEVLRHDGLGDDLNDPRCAHCDTPYVGGAASRIFKCEDCGQYLQCKKCLLSHHACTPLHVVKEWNGHFWEHITLAEVGLVYQLGHGGFPCVVPGDKVYKMTIIEAPVIHQINMRYCNCSKAADADSVAQLLRNAWYPASIAVPGTCATFKTLDTFRLYNVVGNMNVNDFIHAMERVTDATATTGMSWLPDRYRQFQRMARQWAFILRVKRTGGAHNPNGVADIKTGEIAVVCWVCPYDDRNLPAGWRDVEPRFRFLYMLLLAVDANFKLKNRMRPNEIDDPSLGPGLGYWVEPRRYRKHIRKYTAEKDISTCIAFAALLQKDTRLTTGLRASGVGGCVCARHECVRPTGIGDLQKGERYSNMDYIVMSALMGFCLMMLTISYDIGSLDKFTFQCALPVWHAASHNEECQTTNSLSFKPGVGKSDGEGVERVWSVLNPASYHTKDAGRGQRVDVLEDKIDSHNHGKNFGQGDALQRKLIVALAERERQIYGFLEVSATVERNLQDKWVKMVEEWEADPSKTNPYTLEHAHCPSEATVRLEVKKDEDAQLAGAHTPMQGRSATAFLVAGMQIEEAQRRISLEVAGPVLVTADREGKLYDWRRALLVKIGKFRELQNVYMPGAAAAIAAAEGDRDSDAVPPAAEKIKLWMPSEMDEMDGSRGCVRGLPEMEAKLRVGQCTNSLTKLRARLHAKRHLITFRNEHIAGQVQATKARTVIAQVGERVEACAKKYRHARQALISLRGEVETANFRELRLQDIRLDGDDGESDAAARKKLAMIGAGRGARAPRNEPGTSKKVMSWIWTAPGALDDAEQMLHDSIRVEWTRARARKERWSEEVDTLREEMRRALRYLGWQEGWWRERVALRTDVSVEVGAGLRAYALKQADLHRRVSRFWERKWKMPAVAAAERMLAFEAASVEDGPALDEFFAQNPIPQVAPIPVAP
ncbi:hypothetical protein C8R43DRAFT_1140778 [Mycena crocata]|nr:hypothetical protein C8R43DRAFT_1140778 [Mycena crocata]